MLKIRVQLVVLMAATFGVISTVVTSAQEDAGRISGRVYHVNSPSERVRGSVIIAPVNEPQPILIETLLDRYSVQLDDSGSYEKAGLEAGEYFIGLFRVVNGDRLPDLPEEILIREDGSRELIPAARVLVSEGDHIEFDIVISPPPPQATPPPTPAPRYTGGVAGKVELVGRIPSGPIDLLWLPVDVEQPVSVAQYPDNVVSLDSTNHYSITNLPDGAYFVVAPLDADVIAPNREVVDVYYSFADSDQVDELRHLIDGEYSHLESGALSVLGDGIVLTQSTVRVVVADGQTTTGVDFTLRFSEPGPVPVNPHALPMAGDGGGPPDGRSLGGLTLALAAVAAVIGLSTLLGQLRRRRRS
jgi:hypothetical protein